jgi:hypothetical protein
LSETSSATLRNTLPVSTEAWCSGDPTRVAGHFAPGGTIAIDGGPPTEGTEVARSFMSTFPDFHLLMDDVVVKDEFGRVPLDLRRHELWTRWNRKRVRFSGFEEWTFGVDGLVAESAGYGRGRPSASARSAAGIFQVAHVDLAPEVVPVLATDSPSAATQPRAGRGTLKTKRAPVGLAAS